jgi:polysaccharide export outer membrane protein
MAVGGCASGAANVPYSPSNFGAPDTAVATKVPATISSGDKLQIRVYQEETLSGTFQVQTDGNIDFPLIGLVKAEGLTPSDLASLMTRRLGERHLRNPDVQVAISEAALRTITVDGAVKAPGVLPIPGTTTLLRAVALAQGTTESANSSKVIVFRQLQGQRMAAAFDLKAIRQAKAEDPTIYPNDVVVVGESATKGLVKNILQGIPVLGVFRPF